MKGGDAVGEALADHEVTAVGQHRLVEPGDVAQQIVEAVAGDAAGGVQIDAVEGLHQVHMVGDGEIGHLGLTEALDLYVAGVVGAQRHGVVDDLGDHQHALVDLLLELLLLGLQLLEPVGVGGDLGLDGLGLLELGGVLLGLAHQNAHLLGQGVAGGTEVAGLGNGGAVFAVQSDDLVHQGQLLVLELLLDVFFHHIGVFADKFNIQHGVHLIVSFRFCGELSLMFHVKQWVRIKNCCHSAGPPRPP